MLEDDFHTLAAAATARLFANMVLVSQETSPVDRQEDFDVRCRDLLTDLQSSLDTYPQDPGEREPYIFALHYCDAAKGGYWHDPVALAMEAGLSHLASAFEKLSQTPAEAIRDWLQAHADQPHTLAWLSEQTAALMVADATLQTVQ
ncbi:hypothetical protein GGI1_21379 [Acidithiobacillus sp. GGI-221]|jgi:hypothetical protein|nr:hypothetical protein GGI1_21379 [Acidithiobacillus sp. GGI-221]